MKRRGFVTSIFAAIIPALPAVLSMSITQAEAEAKARWGLNGRIWQLWIPKPTGTGWTIQYNVGVQEYRATIMTPFGLRPDPGAGLPLPEITRKGSGSNWTKAFEAAGTR